MKRSSYVTENSTYGPKTFFCVQKDEKLAAEDKLFREEGQIAVII